MSLGLVVADQNGIYLAAESQGLRSEVTSQFILPAKVRLLQNDPPLGIVVAGGLVHWKYVFDCYQKHPDIHSACSHIKSLLNECMTRENQAFGRLCGYDGILPVCYRIDRGINENDISVYKVTSLLKVEVIGAEEHAEKARSNTEDAIASGVSHQQALIDAISSCIPGAYVCSPIHLIIIPQNIT